MAHGFHEGPPIRRRMRDGCTHLPETLRVLAGTRRALLLLYQADPFLSTKNLSSRGSRGDNITCPAGKNVSWAKLET